MRPLRVAARWVLPVGGVPIENGAVLAGAGGRIEAVGPDSAVPAPPGAERVELGEAALLPGLINAHSHLELTALRGLARDLPFFDWIQTVRGLKDALDPAAFRASARWGVLEGFAAGITAHGDTGSTLEAARALADLGARGVAYHEFYGPDPAAAATALEDLERSLAALDGCRSERVAVGVAPHAPYTVSERLLAGAAAIAAARGLPVAMHVAESPEERALLEQGAGPFADHLRGRGIAVAARRLSAVAWLERLGVLALRPLLIHCVTAGEEDFAAMRRHGASVAHCPSSNAALGHGRADLRAMRRAGVVVGLGTDSVAVGGRLDLFAEARLVAQGLGPGGLAARDALGLLTAGGAAALGMASVGTLEPGSWADLTAVDLRGPAFAATVDPEAAVAWAATAADVVFTAVAGRVVYRDGAWPGVAAAEERQAYRRAVEQAAAASRRGAPRGIFGPS